MVNDFCFDPRWSSGQSRVEELSLDTPIPLQLMFRGRQHARVLPREIRRAAVSDIEETLKPSHDAQLSEPNVID